MIGIRTVQFYKEDIANILLQFRIAACSRWCISFNNNRFQQIGLTKDLCYNIEMKQGIQCQFMLILEGLHTLQVDKNTDRNIFRTKMINNTTLYRCDYYDIGFEGNKVFLGDNIEGSRIDETIGVNGTDVEGDSTEDINLTGVEDSARVAGDAPITGVSQ